MLQLGAGTRALARHTAQRVVIREAQELAAREDAERTERALVDELERVKKRLYHAGAQATRLNQDWVLSLHSPDYEARSDLRILRSRARQLARDNPYIRGFLNLIASNVIGWQGMRLQGRHVTDRGEVHERANASIEAAWNDFSLPENSSVTGRLAMTDVAKLVLQTVLVDGECLIRKIKGFPNAHGFSLQLLDADQLDELYNRAASDGVNEIRMGVEIDQWGRSVAYYLYKTHPYEFAAQTARIRVPADEIIHLFLQFRPGQTRGIPVLAVILRDMKMLDGYQEAEIVAARTAAAKMGFFEVDPEKGGGYALPSEPKASDQETQLSLDASPGAIEQLPAGMVFKPWDPQHPTAQYGAFIKAVLRAMAVGLGVSYHSFANDLEAVNYSSARIGMLEERAMYRALQTWMATYFYRPAYTAWLPMALLTGVVRLPVFDAARWSSIAWLPRGWDWVDPFKDLQAASLSIAMGLTSRSRLAAEQGNDFEEILQDLATEKKLAEKYGVILSLDTKLTATPNAGGGDAPAADTSASADGQKDDAPLSEPKVHLTAGGAAVQLVRGL